MLHRALVRGKGERVHLRKGNSSDSKEKEKREGPPLLFKAWLKKGAEEAKNMWNEHDARKKRRHGDLLREKKGGIHCFLPRAQ